MSLFDRVKSLPGESSLYELGQPSHCGLEVCCLLVLVERLRTGPNFDRDKIAVRKRIYHSAHSLAPFEESTSNHAELCATPPLSPVRQPTWQ
jgi:hypothetical protein